MRLLHFNSNNFYDLTKCHVIMQHFQMILDWYLQNIQKCQRMHPYDRDVHDKKYYNFS